VFTEAGRSVRHVLVDGDVVLKDGKATKVDEDALYAEVERLTPALQRDLSEIRQRNERLLPYIEQARQRTMALDVGIDRFRIG
jgi:hypothetical protein